MVNQTVSITSNLESVTVVNNASINLVLMQTIRHANVRHTNITT